MHSYCRLISNYTHNTFSWINVPQAPKSPIGAILNFLQKFAEVFANYCLSPVINCSAVSMTPAKNLLPVSLTPAINLCHGFSVNNLSPVTKTPAITLSPVTTTPVITLSPVTTTPLINIHSRISPQIFKKIRNGPNGILRGPEDTDLWKKTWSRKFRVRLPLRSPGINSMEPILLSNVAWARICKRLRSFRTI